MREADILFAMAAIRKTLMHSPHVKDTAKGVHEFWILWEEPRPLISVTVRALERLQSMGEVEVVRQQDGSMVWRAQPPSE